MLAGRILLTLLSVQIALLTFATFGIGASAQDASLIDCYEFIDQAEAQRFFEVKGGPRDDPYYLDGDEDGIACEPGPEPTPVPEEHAEYCENAFRARDDMRDTAADEYEDTYDIVEDYGMNFTQSGDLDDICADYIEQTEGLPFCPAFNGLKYRYYSVLSPRQLSDLSDDQEREHRNLMDLEEGACVAVDVAQTTAWECQPLPYYIGELDSSIFTRSVNKDEFTKQYQVVCLGAPIELGESRTFSMEYLVGAAVAGAGAVYGLGKYRKNRSSTALDKEDEEEEKAEKGYLAGEDDEEEADKKGDFDAWYYGEREVEEWEKEEYLAQRQQDETDEEDEWAWQHQR